MTYDPYVYELTYSIGADPSERYETWVQNATEQWITTEQVHGFRCEQRLLGASPHVRLVFEFETLADWAVFVTSGVYRQYVERLRTLADGVTETLWESTTIPLDAIPRSSQSVTIPDAGERR